MDKGFENPAVKDLHSEVVRADRAAPAHRASARVMRASCARQDLAALAAVPRPALPPPSRRPGRDGDTDVCERTVILFKRLCPAIQQQKLPSSP